MKEKELKPIVNLYWTQRAAIQLDRGVSNNIDIKRGVRQACVLSPILFNLYTENIFRKVPDEKGIKIGGYRIYNMRYADDTVLLAESVSVLQEILDNVNEAGRQYKMKMNARKTKVMVTSKQEEPTKIKIKVTRTQTEQVNHFIYLGHKITEDGRCS